jgi:hypothetical protein
VDDLLLNSLKPLASCVRFLLRPAGWQQHVCCCGSCVAEAATLGTACSPLQLLQQLVALLEKF